MSCCAFDATIDRQFSEKHAAKELRRCRQNGPGVTTRLLRDGLRKVDVRGQSLLDVGCGIGALTFALLDAGVTSAVALDASSAYTASATEEASRCGHARSVRFIHGDFVALAPRLERADTVTLDRVICCYPEYPELLQIALELATRHFAWSYPKDRWFVRWVVMAENAVRRLKGNRFRTVVHPVPEMQRIINDAGFVLIDKAATTAWATEINARSI